MVKGQTKEQFESMSINDIETIIKKEYVKLLEMGYEMSLDGGWTKKHRKDVEKQEDVVRALLNERRKLMNRTWIHNQESAERIRRVNDLLMRAVRKGIKLAKKTSKSLQWMEKVSNTEHYAIELYIYPEWQDSQSDYRYMRMFKSASQEQDRLINDEDNIADTHIWNIIANLGLGYRREGKASCFDGCFYDYDKEDWDVKSMIGDDGQSWNEGIRYPAYKDVYFTMPFHHLYCDLFLYSFEDLCNIKDFKVNIDVKLKTREQDRPNKRTDSN